MKHALIFSASTLTLAVGTAMGILNAAAPLPVATDGGKVQLSLSRIYWEYNASANDLGVHVTLDGEDWKALRIKRPDKQTIFEVKGKGAYKQLGMTELFFEGAEPSLNTFPLQELLSKFPEGEYDFEGFTVDNEIIEGESMFSHAIPAGPAVSTQQGPNNSLRVNWTPVITTPPGFPARPIVISGYQVIVGSFQVTLPASATSVTVPPEFVASLASGVQPYEVLAIEANGNQTLTEGTFIK